MFEFLIRYNVAFRRTVFFLHALPYWAIAWPFGYAATWVWGSPFSPVIGGWLCTAGVVLLTLRDWWKEWRRG